VNRVLGRGRVRHAIRQSGSRLSALGSRLSALGSRLSIVYLILFGGCGDESSAPQLKTSDAETRPSLIAEADRQFDFGDVIGKPGQKMDHRYRLVNPSRLDVKLVEVVNRKSCCGLITVGKQVLHPGDATDVTVTLVVGDKFGGVVHETEVVTDLPTDASIVLRTSATAHPAFRFEEIASPESEGEASGGFTKPRRAEVRVFATGTAADPIADLDRLELRSTIKAEWMGSKEPVRSDDVLKIESRRLTAWLDTAGPTGDRRAELLLCEGAKVLAKHVVAWEVVSPIAISPKIIVIMPGKRDYQTLVQSRDHKAFRITKIECRTPGLKAHAASDTPASTQIVNVECSPEAVKERGSITVSVDHPDLGSVDLPFVVLD